MNYSRKEHWRGVTECNEDKSNMHAMRWYLYTREKEGFIKREFFVSVPHAKGGRIVWTCVKGNIIKGKEQYEAI